MTLHMLDVSRWQADVPKPLDLTVVKRLGYGAVNIALSSTPGPSGPWARTYWEKARELELGVMVYGWLSARTTGAAQAAEALIRIHNDHGGFGGVVYQVDAEESGQYAPTWLHWRDHVDAMQQALGRHVIAYTGDYWWRPRGWNGAAYTPYLMAPPNDSVLAYPGDTAAAWYAGYGGWGDLSVMQWGVRTLPGTGIKCSLSAIRDLRVWAALSGGQMTQPDCGDTDDAADRMEPHAGEEIPDPWNDPLQLDWPDNPPIPVEQ